MEAFVNEVIMAYGNWRFLMLTTVFLAVGLVFLKNNKRRFVIPALVLATVILNPVFYTLWYRFNDRSFWRMMWMVPIIPVCMIVPAYFIEKCKKDIVKVGILMLATVTIILCGSFIYDGNREVFAAANNPEKLPDDVVAVGEALLELDDYPMIVADGTVSTYIRQYSGNIITPYTRSATWGYPTGIGGDIYGLLIEQNMSGLAQEMLNNDYDYLVTSNLDEVKKRAIEDGGFELLKQVFEYGIYKVHGNKTKIRTYNDFHQTISITTVDDAGNPINGEDGYATIHYGYDDRGYTNYVFYTDLNGKGVEDNNGRAGYRCEYNNKRKVVKREYLNSDGDLVKNGLAVVVSEYKGDLLSKEYYYDANEQPINISESGYALKVNEYDSDKQLSLSYYYDSDGNYVKCGSSFFHEYLQSLANRDAIIFISVKDEASEALTSVLVDDMYNMGIKTDLRNHYRGSFCAVISSNNNVEEIVSNEAIHYEDEVDGLKYSISSAGWLVGNYSSIVINGKEYSKNDRGINIVVVEHGLVTESIAFDTHDSEMKVSR